MRRIIHLSDLHFGALNESLLNPLVQTIHEIMPHVIAVSGDLTQRARSQQFEQAKHFLEQLNFPKIVVPGNHDISLHNLWKRFASPLKNYKKYISEDLQPVYEDEELLMIGVNTARSSVLKNGRINLRQIEEIKARLEKASPRQFKVIVSHHPFDLPSSYKKRDLVGRSFLALQAFVLHKVDLFLAGHLHLGQSLHQSKRYPLGDYSPLLIQAGTATSHRRRGETNSFNVVELEGHEMKVQRWLWSPSHSTFKAQEKTEGYNKTSGFWKN